MLCQESALLITDRKPKIHPNPGNLETGDVHVRKDVGIRPYRHIYFLCCYDSAT